MLPRYVEAWENAIRDRMFNRILILLLAVALFANGIYRHFTAQVVIYPPVFSKKVWVKPHSASRDYLEQMALAYLHFTLDLTPTNADGFVGYVINNLKGDKAASISQQLLTDAYYVKKNNIYQTFFPASLTIENNTITIKGTISRKVGGQEVLRKNVCYRLQLEIDNFVAYITDLVSCTESDTN